MSNNSKTNKNKDEPRWLVLVATLAAALIYAALPSNLSVGPRWLLLAVMVAVVIPTLISHRAGYHTADKMLGYLGTGILTIAMMWSLGLLVAVIPKHEIDPKILLRSAVALWVTNILIFALWYWRLDAGGPNARDMRAGHPSGSFLFPQMTFRPDEIPDEWKGWSPRFIDYLFLAFNTSTAFSPTDTAVLTRGAKLGMMAQSLISLTIIVLIAARAVNIL